MSAQNPRWRTAWPWIAGFLGLAALGIAVATGMFASWSDLRDASSADATTTFAASLAKAAASSPNAATPYLHIDPAGHVLVRRELEGDSPMELQTLHLLAWDPRQDKLLQVAFPFWFVRVKMNDTINLGTMATALSGDWDNLELKVSVAELCRRGAGVVLDHTRQDGLRLLLWSEAP
jgi:hypothetical protein